MPPRAVGACWPTLQSHSLAALPFPSSRLSDTGVLAPPPPPPPGAGQPTRGRGVGGAGGGGGERRSWCGSLASLRSRALLASSMASGAAALGRVCMHGHAALSVASVCRQRRQPSCAHARRIICVPWVYTSCVPESVLNSYKCMMLPKHSAFSVPFAARCYEEPLLRRA